MQAGYRCAVGSLWNLKTRLSLTLTHHRCHVRGCRMEMICTSHHIPVQPPNMAAQHLEVLLYYQLIYTVCLCDSNNRIKIANKGELSWKLVRIYLNTWGIQKALYCIYIDQTWLHSFIVVTPKPHPTPSCSTEVRVFYNSDENSFLTSIILM